MQTTCAHYLDYHVLCAFFTSTRHSIAATNKPHGSLVCLSACQACQPFSAAALHNVPSSRRRDAPRSRLPSRAWARSIEPRGETPRPTTRPSPEFWRLLAVPLKPHLHIGPASSIVSGGQLPPAPGLGLVSPLNAHTNTCKCPQQTLEFMQKRRGYCTLAMGCALRGQDIGWDEHSVRARAAFVPNVGLLHKWPRASSEGRDIRWHPSTIQRGCLQALGRGNDGRAFQF